LRRSSGGNQQKVVIARWLASGFDTLLCFDPTRAIDIGTKRQVYALVREIAAEGSRCCCSLRNFPRSSLSGGSAWPADAGGMLGPVIAAFVLTLIPTDLIFLDIDPNFGQVIQGTLIVVIVMIGGFVDKERSRK
jgi:hypothetical protein